MSSTRTLKLVRTRNWAFLVFLLGAHGVFPHSANAAFEEWALGLPWLDESLQCEADSESDLASHKAADPLQSTSLETRRLVQIREENLDLKIQKHCAQSRGLGLGKFCGTVFKTTTSAAFSVGLTVLADSLRHVCLNWLGVKTNGAEKANFLESAAQITSDQLMIQLIGGTINQSIAQIRQDVQGSAHPFGAQDLECLREVHEELIQESKEHLKTLPEDVQAQIQKLDNAIRQEKGMSEVRVDFMRTLLRRRELVLLSLPYQPKNVAQYDKMGSAQLRLAIDQKAQELISESTKENQEAIKSFIQEVRDSSVFVHTDRAQAYLYGPPGTGKTHFVHNLAKKLDLPLCELSLKDVKESDLLGNSFESLTNLTEKDVIIIGKLAKCFIDAGVTNPILFFDEAGEALSKDGLRKNSALASLLKDLLDPERKAIRLKGLGIEIDFSRATVIFAGNHLLEDSALRSRLPSIYFGQLGITEKSASAREAFAKTLTELSDVFLAEDVDQIQVEFERYLDAIVLADLERNPGARIIKGVVRDVLNYIRVQVLNREIVDADKIQIIIKDSLDHRSPVLE